MFGKPKLKVINAKLKVPSLGIKLPPPAALVAALYTVLGTGFGVPVSYDPVPGVEVRVDTAVLKDPRVTRTKSYLFIGLTSVFRERAGTYEVVMPPSTASTDLITKALGRVMMNAVRWEKVVFFVAQYPTTGAVHALFDKDNVKKLRRPWGRPNPAGVPPPDTIVGLGEGVKYGDVVSVHDGVVDTGLVEEFPEHELGYVIYDDDIVSVTYVVNPSRVSAAFRRVTEFGVKPLKELLQSIGKEDSKGKEGGESEGKGKERKGRKKGLLRRLRGG